MVKSKVLIGIIFSVFLQGCETTPKPTQNIVVSESILVPCTDWKELTSTDGSELIGELRINRINHQICYERNLELVNVIRILTNQKGK